MSNRKSSITAELKLAGLSGFKSELGQAGVAARSLGRDLQTIKPINFDGGANQARKSWQLTEEHQRAHHRVLERQAKANQGRMAAMGGKGGGGSGRFKGGGGLSPGGNAGQAYNFVQDLAQGGLPAVANNVPWLIEAAAKSPGLRKGLAGAAAAAAVGWGIKSVYDAYQDHGSVANESARMAAGRGLVRSQWEANTQSNELTESGLRGTVQGKSIAENDAHSRKMRGIEEMAYQSRIRKEGMLETLRQAKIASGHDEQKVIRDTANSEVEFLDKRTTAEESYSKTSMDLAQKRRDESVKQAEEAEAELFAIQHGNRRAGSQASDKELRREAELTNSMPAIQARASAAKQEYDAAIARVAAAKSDKEAAAVTKDLIRLKEEADIKAAKAAETMRDNQRELTRYEHRVSAIEQENRKQYEREQDQKKRDETDSSLSEREAMSKMSPRALAKYQEKKRIKDDTDEFIKQGYTPEQAANRAKRENQLSKDNDPSRKKRIRGAGYGGSRGEDANGLGSATYGGLDDLAAMQPAASRERKTIKGAGAKEKQSGSNDNPSANLYQVMAKGFADVVKAVRDTGPNATDRAKPTSTRTSTN